MSGVKNFSVTKRNNVLLKFIISGLAFLVVLVALNFFSSGIKNAFFVLTQPIEKTFWAAGEAAAGYLSSIIKAGSLEKENNGLKNENQKLLSEISALKAISVANQAQSDLSAACQNLDFEYLMAGVMGLEQNDILTINVGSEDGIAENMPVVTSGNALLGRIYKAYKDFSEVQLISSKDSVVNVEILGSGVAGAARGQGNLGVMLDLVPISDDINKDDILISSPLESVFPKGFLVGKIIQPQRNDQKPFQQAQVEPFFNIKAGNVFIITNYKR